MPPLSTARAISLIPWLECATGGSPTRTLRDLCSLVPASPSRRRMVRVLRSSARATSSGPVASRPTWVSRSLTWAAMPSRCRRAVTSRRRCSSHRASVRGSARGSGWVSRCGVERDDVPHLPPRHQPRHRLDQLHAGTASPLHPASRRGVGARPGWGPGDPRGGLTALRRRDAATPCRLGVGGLCELVQIRLRSHFQQLAGFGLGVFPADGDVVAR